MGCSVSRLDSHGHPFSARLRPLLLQRFDEMKARRHHVGHPLKDTTPSKKELLSSDDIDKNTDEYEINNNHNNNDGRYKAHEAKDDDVFMDADDDVEDDDESDSESERRIGHREEDAFPGSPSFRVYFKDNEIEDNGHVGIGKNDVSKKKMVSREEVTSSKVLPTNLLGVKSCYTPSHSHASSLDNSQFLVGKTTT
ncbi:P-loop nucleoside triphosphate hydrolasessuperfamily protein with CH (Calponin Homology) domain [Striga asiatica]|uniref:P-loop nucleoside triphosphate hydrolasessuperfamily protein with CH (Calponin Homology) domain n=1 Tax=Striga asiatica TaxID=4170 RepID=A0A5A7QJI9_STRAF|nr:P-loop nucleoside triphosphate hydrolasessuperfamily protein with CH (Calponin Homology) domain [Striga asiatica]